MQVTRLISSKITLSVLLTLCGANTVADTLTLELTDDAFINANQPASNRGSGPDLRVHNWGPKQALVRFDAAPLAGTSIDRATLKLFLSDLGRAGTVGIHAVVAPWSEADVTWLNRPSSEPSPIATAQLGPADEGAVVSIDVTAAAQRWASGDLTDAGFLIATDDAIGALFDAKEKVGGIAAELEIDTGADVFDAGVTRVLDLSDPADCVISAPGLYLLDRSWLLTPDDGEYPNATCGALHIASPDVTLDMRGFAIRKGDEGLNYEGVLWIDTTGRVTLRGGRLLGRFVAVEASVASSNLLTLDQIHANGAVLLGDRKVQVTGGSFTGDMEVALRMRAGSQLTGATLSCTRTHCLGAGSSSLVRDCTFSVNTPGAPAIALSGNNSLISNNRLDAWVDVRGDNNVIEGNVAAGGAPYFEVSGAGNVIDGNIGPGIHFVTPGNFYGDNRVATPESIQGATGNTDWGGNVNY